MSPNLKKLIVCACLALAVAGVLIKVRPTSAAAGGDIDPTFNAGGSGTNGKINAMVVQPDGKTVIAGEFDKYNGATVSAGVIRLNANGSLDNTFNPGGSGLVAFSNPLAGPHVQTFARALALQADGKILVVFEGAGNWNFELLTPTFFGILRLNSDGSIDNTFNSSAPPTLRGASVTGQFTGSVEAVAVLPNAKIVIGGAFGRYNGVDVPDSLILLNSDGSWDSSFNPGGTGVQGVVYALAVISNGDGIWVGGEFETYNGVSHKRLVHVVVATGLPTFFAAPQKFDSTVRAVALPSQGILVGGDFTANPVDPFKTGVVDVPDKIMKLGIFASVDTTFNKGGTGADGTVRAIAVQPDGKILIAGDFTSYDGDALTPDRLTRLNPDGTRDTTFNPTGTGVDGSVNAVALQPDGKILIAGSFTSYNGNANVPDNIIRVFPTSEAVAFSSANYTVPETDGKANITVKRTDAPANETVAKISLTDVTTTPADYFTVGAYDASFNNGGSGVAGNVLAITAQPDGNTLVGGQFFAYNGNASAPKGVMRLKRDGTLDPGFSGAGTGANNDVNAIALQPDGKILIGGNFTSYDGDASAPDRIMRLNPNGSRDISFLGIGANGVVRAIAVQPDGQILIGGDFTDYNGAPAPDKIIRLNSDGTLDTLTFNSGSGANGSVNAIALQPDGKIVIGGSFTSYNGDGAAPDNILRLQSLGTLDPTFTGSGTNNQVRAVVAQPDGKIIIGGDFTDYNGAAAPDKVLRLTGGGALDSSFNSGGAGLNPIGLVTALALQPDGAVVVAGVFTNYNGNAATPSSIMRLTPSGAWDSTFNPGGSGSNAGLNAMALQPDGKILIGGSLTFLYNGAAVPPRLTRLSGDIFVRWAAGDFSDKTIELPIKIDGINEPDETLTLALSIMSGAASLGTPATATLTIQDPNDPPVTTVPGAQTINEDIPLIFSSANGNQISVADPDAGASGVQVTVSSTHGLLSLNGTTGLNFNGGFGDGTDDVNLRFTGTVANINTALNGMTFKPAANFNGAAIINVLTRDLGHTGAGGPKESPTGGIPITINSVNDVPSFVKGPDVTVLINAPAQNILLWAKNVSRGAADESSQVINFIVSNNNNLLFSAQPAINALGHLAFTPAAGQTGQATVSVQIHDTGGTANGGVDTSAVQTFLISVVPNLPTLGNYPDTTLNLGANTTIIPSAAPTNDDHINVETSTNFKGILTGDPLTGILRVTNAATAGTYTVAVKAFEGAASVTKTFTLTVQTGGTPCAGVTQFNNAADVDGIASPIFVAVGDFNNDGNQDLAIAKSNSNTVSIRLGNGAGNFSGLTEVSVGNSAQKVAVGDFNNDGNQDLAVSNIGGSVSIRLGDGAGNFSGTSNVSVGANPTWVAIGDFNNDGKQDLAVTLPFTPAVAIRLGDGLGGFSASTNVGVGANAGEIAIGDFDNDGKQDLAVTSFNTDTVAIRLGDGAGNFSGSTDVSIGDGPLSVTVGDFNSDGNQDLAVANSFSFDVSILLGNGTGAFLAAPSVSVGSNAIPVVIGDLNNDGKPDLLVGTGNIDAVAIRFGDGAGGFFGSNTVSVGDGNIAAAIGDFNGDGKQDFATANSNSNTLSVRLGGGCNLAPTITAANGLSRRQGSPAGNSQIATVTDDGGNVNVTVKVNGATSATVNGVTVSNIVNTGGSITADIVADCTASDASFALLASDSLSTASTTLDVTVNPNTAPILSYFSPQNLSLNGSLVLNPTTLPGDNGSIASVVLQNAGTFTGAISVNDTTGAVSISNAAPAGMHVITIRATDNCGAITDSSFTLDVAKANQTINFGAVPNTTFGDADFIVIPTASSGLTVSLSASGNCTVTGTSPGTVHITAAGSCTITASQSGNGNYNAATNLQQTFPIAKADQSITFGSLANKTFGDADFNVSPTASSGLTVSLSASGNCTVTGTSPGTVHITAAGSCTITASQAGDGNYNAATNVSQLFDIAKASTSTTVSSSLNPSPTGDSVSFTATVTSPAGTPTGTVAFKDNGSAIASCANVVLVSGKAICTTSSLSAGNHAVTADYSGDTNFKPSTGTLSGGQNVTNEFHFLQALFTVAERGGAVTITVQRSGDTSQTGSVDYATDDGTVPTVALPCSTANGKAFERCDYERAAGKLNFAAGETQKTFMVLINDDSYVEGPETTILRLSNPIGASLGQQSTATLQINDDAAESSGNPIDDDETFVAQHYRDFLNRQPDPDGLKFWVDSIKACGNDQQCRGVKRINTSAAFFVSIEFQQTGFFIERIYRTAFGDAVGVSTLPGPHQLSVPGIRFAGFIRDAQQISSMPVPVIVGQGNWQQQLASNKQAFALNFVQRPEFLARYPGVTSASAFVNLLDANVGGVLNDAEKSALIAELSSNSADATLRANVLRKLADNPTFQSREFNRAFVLMQYFGYLRRNPNDAPDNDYSGYENWLKKLDQFNGDFVRAEMVRAFITSDEFLKRFGP